MRPCLCVGVCALPPREVDLQGLELEAGALEQPMVKNATLIEWHRRAAGERTERNRAAKRRRADRREDAEGTARKRRDDAAA